MVSAGGNQGFTWAPREDGSFVVARMGESRCEVFPVVAADQVVVVLDPAFVAVEDGVLGWSGCGPVASAIPGVARVFSVGSGCVLTLRLVTLEGRASSLGQLELEPGGVPVIGLTPSEATPSAWSAGDLEILEERANTLSWLAGFGLVDPEANEDVWQAIEEIERQNR
ncbi:MAG: hypothetical protein H6735_32485 [Alphaproteobacteria bacterium]|nr:hypothetical protein [Alphaproteobacteria bacterium]